MEIFLASVLRSESWKLTTPLRSVGKFLRSLKWALSGLIEGLIRRKYRPELIPIHHLEAIKPGGDYNWKSIGNDPRFLLSEGCPKGWAKLSWDGAAEHPTRLILYINRGSGFNDTNTINLGLISGEQTEHYEAWVHLGSTSRDLRLDPGEGPGSFTLKNISLTRVSRLEVFYHALNNYLRRQGFSFKYFRLYIVRALAILRQEGIHGLWLKAKNQITPSNPATNTLEYDQWLRFNRLTDLEIEGIRRHITELKYKPVFSVIVPVYNVEEIWLRKCLDSVLAQLYPFWELCIADDASSKTHIRKVLEEYLTKDERIKVVFRSENGHISAASNTALELATGDFIVLLDHDDELTLDALYENALLLNKYPLADMIYSDEDKISEEGKCHSPFLKPDWSPDLFLSQMYTCHLGVYRRELVESIGGFRVGFEGTQDYDLVLRFTEKTKEIFHIPKILYHWRTIPGSTAAIANSKDYAFQAGEVAIREALIRRGEKAWVEAVPNYPGHYRVHYKTKGEPLITIIIPTRDMYQLLSSCLDSIFKKSTYVNFEVLIVDNGSQEIETIALFNKWSQIEPRRFRVIRLDIPFNYSRLNNEAVKYARGELLLLLNNDIEVITPNWLEEMAGQAMRSSIGVVGAMLYYPDETIQHAGVILGIGGVAGHIHKGLSNEIFGYFNRMLNITNYSAVTGACLMVKKVQFELVGGLEERLTVAFNDVDFCLKLQEKGYYNVVLPQVKLYHHESKSRGFEDTPEKRLRFISEIEFIQKRWGGLLIRDPFYNPNLTLDREDFSLALNIR